MQDLKDEFDKVASRSLAELKALRSGGKMSLIEIILLRAIEKRMAAHLENKKSCDYTLEKVVSRLMRGHENEKVTKEYTDCVRSMERLVRFCSKCRKCLRYGVMRT